MRKLKMIKLHDYNERSRTSYNNKADGYDNSREGQFTHRIHQLLLPMLNWRTGQSMLDVACGTGSLLAAMNNRKQIRGYGIDISERMIEIAVVRNPGMEFRVSGCEGIPFPDGSMDIITVCAAYHHFPDVSAFAKEAGRVLKPNGLIYIADMYASTFIRVLINPFVPLLFKDGDVRFYSPKEIIKNFALHGFTEADAKTAGNLQIVTMQKK
ncbi:MAG: class I SAM-dependent methyltransferase [Oscillospiraceae bacterium]|nr:class I SAM-dependent methyltransferase [Oscillospiraceae bacterium]